MKIIKIFLLMITLATISACTLGTQDISEIKSEEYIDQQVTVYGTVTNSMNIGDFSGYTIEDETGTIAVESDNIPEVGDEVRVSGTLKQNPLGYYIDENN